MMKKTVKISLVCFLLLFIGFNAWVVFSGKTFFYKALRYNFVNIDDYTLFSNRIISKSNQPKPWAISSEYNKRALSDSLTNYLEAHETVSFLIIKNDSLVYEKYWEGYSDTSLSNSFSMAKSFVGAMVGVALQEGNIKSINQSVCDFLPEFCEGEKSIITIRHLLMMSSGLNWEEGYASPFSVTTESYYGKDLKGLIGRLEVVETPGTVYRYKSGDTQLLAFVLEAATGKKLGVNISEKIWAPLGAEQNALWCLDKEGGDEKAYCCLNSNARDFARIGKLYLDSGMVDGKRLLPLAYYLASVTPNNLPDGDLSLAPTDFYGYQWWTIPNYKNHFVFYARGILGQYVIVVPDLKIIIVRLGHKRGENVGKHFKEVYLMLDEVL